MRKIRGDEQQPSLLIPFLYYSSYHINLSLVIVRRLNGAPKGTPPIKKKIGRRKHSRKAHRTEVAQRKARAEARKRGEILKWTGPILLKLHHNTREGKREAILRRSLVEPCVVPLERSFPNQERWQRRNRFDYIQRGLERGYPLL